MNQTNISNLLIVKAQSHDNTIISGYASVYDFADQQNDVISKGAFAMALQNPSTVKLLWQHNQAAPIGVVRALVEDNYGLRIEADINNKISKGIEAIELIKQGALNGLSVGFQIEESHYDNDGKRIISKANLIEISVVTFPANQKAQIYRIYDNSLEEISAGLLELEQLLS